MTLKEAKKILKKEMVFSFHSTKPFVFDESGWIEHEKPSVLEAFRVLAKGGYYISISGHDYNMREKRLKKEHEKNNKESAHDKKSMTLEEAKDMLMKEGFKLEGPGKPCDVSECFIELESPEICEAMQIVCSAGYMIMMEVCDFNARKARLKEQLEEHRNAPTSGSPALKEAASQFNDALLDEQGKKIKHLTKKIARLNKIIHKKNEELRLTKIREKNLAEVCQKYMKEVEELNEKAKSVNMHRHKELAEKDEVIADLGKELAEAKKLNTAKILDINAKCMRAARESINDVFESYAAKYAKSTLDELKDKAYETFNAKAHKLGLVGSKDGKGIPDQMIRVDIAEELSKVPDDVIDQFLLFGEIIIKEDKVSYDSKQ